MGGAAVQLSQCLQCGAEILAGTTAASSHPSASKRKKIHLYIYSMYINIYTLHKYIKRMIELKGSLFGCHVSVVQKAKTNNQMWKETKKKTLSRNETWRECEGARDECGTRPRGRSVGGRAGGGRGGLCSERVTFCLPVRL